MANFVIELEVGLKESTIQRLGQVFTACLGGARTPAPAKPAAVETRPAAPAAPAPKPEAPKPAETPAVSANDINAAVVKAMGQGVSEEELRGLLTEFGLKKFSACPEEKRAELLARIEGLPLPF